MAKARVRHVADSRALHVLLTSPDGAVAKDLFRRGVKVQNKAKKNLQRDPRRVNTGNLRSRIHVQLITIGGVPVVRVGTNVFYAVFVHDGTGIYGPKGVPIRPRVAKVLSWKTRGGRRVFARQVKGMKPNPFLKNAVSAARD